MDFFARVNAECMSRFPLLLEQWLPGGRVEGREYVCADLNGGPGRSLSINLQSGVWRDFATDEGGTDPVSLFAAINNLPQGKAAHELRQMFGLNGAASSTVRRRMIAEYDYVDAEGHLLFQVVRFEPKDFRQRRPDGKGGWIWNLNDVELAPYRLPEVLKATDVFIVEGEKDADRLAQLDLTATCNAQGAGKWRTSYVPWFEGKRVCILPDNDEPGRKHAHQVAASLSGVASDIRILDLPGTQPKGDVSDWLAAGGTRAELLALALEAHRWTSTTAQEPPDTPQHQLKAASTTAPPTLVALDASAFLDLDIPERDYILYPVIPSQGIVEAYAPRGIGKTFVALSIALAVSTGGRIFGWKAPQPRRVLYIDGEMPARGMQERLRALIKGWNSIETSPDFLHIITPDLQPMAMPDLATAAGQAAVEPFLQGVSLLIMDNLSTLCRTGKENESWSWLPVQGWLLDLRRRGLSTLLIHHAGKSGDQRGTSAKEDIMDTVISLKRPNDYAMEQGARFEVHLTKARGIVGEEAKSFEATLHSDGRSSRWLVRPIEDVELDTLKACLAANMSIRDIAEEMGKSKSTIHRMKEKLRLLT